MQEDLSIVVSDRTSTIGDLNTFFIKISCAQLFADRKNNFSYFHSLLDSVRYYDSSLNNLSIEEIFDHSPQFGKYIKETVDQVHLCTGGKVYLNGRPFPKIDIEFEIDQLYDIRQKFKLEFKDDSALSAEFSPLPFIWQWVATGLAFGCAAGGSKALLDLIKIWVEERKGRRRKIKRGDAEIEIVGGVSSAEIQKALDLFEEKFGKSRIIQP